jgi:hypothetical protein
MASMRNGQGDDFFAFFNSRGCFFKGFVHDAAAAALDIAPSEYYRGIPRDFKYCISEPAFKTDDVTLCLWQRFEDSEWMRSSISLPGGNDPDGSNYLLSPLDGDPRTYQKWAESYYERDVEISQVASIYERQRLTDDLVIALNPSVCLQQMKEDIREIGYPV